MVYFLTVEYFQIEARMTIVPNKPVCAAVRERGFRRSDAIRADCFAGSSVNNCRTVTAFAVECYPFNMDSAFFRLELYFVIVILFHCYDKRERRFGASLSFSNIHGGGLT